MRMALPKSLALELGERLLVGRLEVGPAGLAGGGELVEVDRLGDVDDGDLAEAAGGEARRRAGAWSSR